MELNHIAVISTAINRNILLGIVQNGTSKNAVARKAGIPATTFDRKITGTGAFTIPELAYIADALGLTLADIIPADLIKLGATG